MHKQPISPVADSAPLPLIGGGGDDAPTPPPPPLPEDPGGDPTPRPWPTDPDTGDEPTARPWPTDPDTKVKTRQFDGSEGTGKVYALLIGIDDYDMPRADLKGCVRDSREVERYLRENIDRAEERLHLRCLRSIRPGDEVADQNGNTEFPVATEEHRSAKRADIIEAFSEFLTQAGPKDAVFIHYSGHGTTYKKPEELQRLDSKENSSPRGEALMPQDAFMRNEKGVKIAPLRDQEIRWMIHRIAANNPHIVLLMDCCNSSGNTRTLGEEEVAVRFTPNDEAAPSDIKSFVFYNNDPQLKELFDQKRSDFSIPQGRHLALAACHNYELAKEINFDEGKFGAFTYYMLQTLRTTRGRIRYRDLIKLVRAKTVAKVSYQSPQYFSPISKDVDQYFLDRSAAKEQSTYTVTPGSESGQGTMDAGSLHGIYPVAEGTTHLLLFPPGTDLKTAKAADGLTATVTDVKAHESHIQLAKDSPQFADGVAFYQAIVTAAPMPVTKVGIVAEIDETVVPADQDEKLAAGIAHLKAAIEASPFIQLSDQPTDRQFKVFVYRYRGEDKFRIAAKDKVDALIQPKTGLTEANAKVLVEDLAHIARWERTLNLRNDHPAIIQPDDLELIAIDADGNEIKDHNGTITFHLIGDDRPLTPPRQTSDGKEYIIEVREGETKPKLKFKVELRNKQQVMIYCGLLQLGSDFSIKPDRLPPETHLGKTSYVEVDGIKIDREVWDAYAGSQPGRDGQPKPFGRFISFYIPEGKEEDSDHFKLIASTEQFDPMHLWQGPLERAGGTRNASTRSAKSQLSALMRTVATRAGDFEDEEEVEAAEQVTDWWTTTIEVKIKRIPKAGAEVPQGAGK